MKKFSTLFFSIVVMSLYSMAQTFITHPNDTVVATLLNNNTAQYKIQQINNTNDTLSLDIEVVKNTIPSGWDGMVCLFGSCLGQIPAVGYTASQSDLINPTDTGYVRLTADPLNVGGGGELRIYVFDVDFPLNGDTLTWIINPTATSVDEFKSNLKTEVYPNPTSDNVTISSAEQVEAIKFYTLTGALYYQENGMNKNRLEVDLEQFAPGVYFIQVEGTTKILNTQKIIVN